MQTRQNSSLFCSAAMLLNYTNAFDFYMLIKVRAKNP